MRNAKFHTEGYAVLRLERVVAARVPPLEEVRDDLTRRLLREQVKAVREQIKAEVLDAADLSVDQDALAACDLVN